MPSSTEDQKNYQEYYYQIKNDLSITNVTKADAFNANDNYCVVRSANWLKPNSGSIHEVVLYDKNQNVGLRDGIFQLTFEARSPRGSFVAIIKDEKSDESTYTSYPLHRDSYILALTVFKNVIIHLQQLRDSHSTDLLQEISRLTTENNQLKSTIAAIKKMASQTARNRRKQNKA